MVFINKPQRVEQINQNGELEMSKRDYNRGSSDGEHKTYNPPGDVIDKIFVPKDYVEKKQDYDDGYRHGKKDAKRKK